MAQPHYKPCLWLASLRGASLSLSCSHSLSLFLSPLASTQSLLTLTDTTFCPFSFSPIFCHSLSVPCFPFSCLLHSIHTLSLSLSLYNCGFSHWLSDSEQGPLKSSHLSVFACFSLFSHSAFFLGMSLPVSPQGTPLWITIQFSPNYLVAFAAFDT